VAAAALAAALGLVACGGGGGSGQASRATTTTAAPTTVPGASDTCPGFRGATTELESTDPVAPGLLVDADAGERGCLDFVTLTFRATGDGTPPGYRVYYRDPAQEPFVDGDPPSPIEVPGNAFLAIMVKPAASVDISVEDHPPTYTGNLSLAYGDHHHLDVVRELPDGDGTVNWVVGLDGVRPFRVDRARGPDGTATVTVLIG
jgi:hypothetical protein